MRFALFEYFPFNAKFFVCVLQGPYMFRQFRCISSVGVLEEMIINNNNNNKKNNNNNINNNLFTSTFTHESLKGRTINNLK